MNSRFDYEARVHAILSKENDPEFRTKYIRLDETHHPKIARLAMWTERWIKAAAMNEKGVKTRMVIFSGRTGTGKTHALRAAHQFLRSYSGAIWPKFHRLPPGIRWVHWSKSVTLERYGWEEFEEEIRQSTFVFVDDLGSEVDRFKTGEPGERLRLFLDHCRNKWVMISTNVTRDDFAKTFDARVLSRLEMAACLDLSDAPDFRPKLQDQPNTK